MDSEVVSLPPDVRGLVERLVSDWTVGDHVGRVWSRDAALWTGGDEPRWLGWLDIAGEQLEHLAPLQTLQQDIADGPFNHAVLLGMGGSSLCPDVLRQSFGRVAGAPDLRVLDSTDPAQVRSVEQQIDLQRTLFIVSSKSGTTMEPTLLYRYFRHRVQSLTGEEEAGKQFIAVTDPGSQLEQASAAGQFRQVFHGVPSIGGRYSALSHFGMVPAAVMGLDVRVSAKTCGGCSRSMHGVGSACRQPGRHAGADAWAPPRARAAIRSHSSRRPGFESSGRGSSNCSRNRPANARPV